MQRRQHQDAAQEYNTNTGRRKRNGTSLTGAEQLSGQYEEFRSTLSRRGRNDDDAEEDYQETEPEEAVASLRQKRRRSIPREGDAR